MRRFRLIGEKAECYEEASPDTPLLRTGEESDDLSEPTFRIE